MLPIKVKTRDGRNARIICIDRKSSTYPIVALIDNLNGDMEDSPQTFTKDGRISAVGGNDAMDLMFVEKHTGWVNIYIHGNGADRVRDPRHVGFVYDTREMAIANSGNNVIATAEIAYETKLDLAKLAGVGDVEKAA